MDFKRFIKNYGSTILTCVSAAGTIVTAVIAVKETPKAIKLLEEAKAKKGEDLTAMEKIKIAGHAYIPSISIGISTIACMFGANILDKRQTASMAGAYALASSSFIEYKNKLKELYGEESDAKIREEILREKHVAHPNPIYASTLCMNVNDLASEFDKKETVLFWDDFSQRYFEASPLDVFAAEYHLNRNFSISGVATPNDFYEFLGIPKVKGGDAVGWSSAYGYTWVDFDHKKVTFDDGMECYIIYAIFPPEDDYFEC